MPLASGAPLQTDGAANRPIGQVGMFLVSALGRKQTLACSRRPRGYKATDGSVAPGEPCRAWRPAELSI